MNTTRESELTAIILDAFTTVVRRSGVSKQGGVSPQTRLYGAGSDIDSLGLVGLLIELEERVSERYGVPVSLTDEHAMSQEHSPFRTVGSLAAYLDDLLANHRG